MTSQSFICILCFNNAEDKDLQVINTSIRDMLGTLLINIDISASENSVICWTCHRKLENNYCFKKKCIFTEDTLSPFVAENVKINLNEIRSQIFKSEVEVEKNVCRLCLQYSDDDMTLNTDETQQVQGLFPEINLNLTNFVILCLTCYNTLHKYFTFVMPLHSNKIFDNPSKDKHKTSTNVEESDEKNVLLLTGEMGIKNEEDFNDFLDEKLDIDVGQIIDMKSEDTKLSLMEIEESDDMKPVSLHEELDIKCHGDSSVEECHDLNHGDISTSFKPEESNCCRSLPKENISNRQISQMHKCNECSYKTKWRHNLKQHCISKHTDPSKIEMIKCNECSYKTKHIESLKRHMLTHATNLSEITTYKCEKCDFESKWHVSIKRHIISKHTDPSEIQMYKCKECRYEAKDKANLKSHMLIHTINLSEVKMYKCDKCDHESKRRVDLKNHLINKHTNPSEILMYKCKECNFETKQKGNLKQHMLTHVTDLSEITTYKCDKCDYESKWSVCIKKHIISKHTDPSEILMHKCQECSYVTKHKAHLKQHMLTHATNLSEITTYKCDKCDYESKWRDNLRKHRISKHISSSEIQMYKCKECIYEAKHKVNLKSHMLTHATNISKTAVYKCGKCEYQSKLSAHLRKHIFVKHTDSSKVSMCDK